MIINKNNKYTKTKVVLDNNSFEECTFQGCILEFGATGPVGLNKCTFNECQWSFVGNAALTLQFLNGLYSGLGDSGSNLVEKLFDDIRQGISVSSSVVNPNPNHDAE